MPSRSHAGDERVTNGGVLTDARGHKPLPTNVQLSGRGVWGEGRSVAPSNADVFHFLR